MPDDLSRTFAALADPTRRDMVARLTAGDATVGELAQPYAMSMQAVSKHLKVLERAGLIERGRDGQARPSRLRTQALDDAVRWMETRKRTWEGRMDRLDAYLQQQRT